MMDDETFFDLIFKKVKLNAERDMRWYDRLSADSRLIHRGEDDPDYSDEIIPTRRRNKMPINYPMKVRSLT